jgi:phage terminase large subunit-like protein
MGRPRSNATTTLNTNEMLMELREGIKKQINRPNLYAYTPHKKQRLFHKSEKHTKLYIGGNRSGKTTGGVVEDIFWAMGRHPFRKVPDGPTRGRVAAVDFIQGVEKIILPEFGRWVPPSFLIDGSWEQSYSKSLRTLTLTNGSFIEFMSYDQDLDKFAGTSRHWTHYDEEPPKHVFNECEARLVDTGGSSWLTMTPVEGMSWVYDDLYHPGKELGDPDIEVIEVDMLDNPHVSKEAAERFLRTLDKDEREAREHGKFVQLGGRVFKQFSKDTHVVESFTPPLDWEWYVSIDHGFNNPTAMLWHAVSPKDEVITFSEHYKSEMTVAEHAAVFHARNAMLGRVPDVICGDPAMHQRSAITGTSIIQEYADNGVYISTEGIPRDVQVGVNRMTGYLRLNPDNKCHWHITENCDALINEMLRLRWKTWANRKGQYENNKHEQIHKKDDHACDSARYFFTLLPDLTPMEERDPTEVLNAALAGAVGHAVTAAPVSGSWDQLLARQNSQGGGYSGSEGHSGSSQKWRISASSDLAGFEYD